MQITQCYHCERNASEFFDKEIGYSLLRCTLCGLLFVSPQPSESERSESIRTGYHAGERKLNVNAKWDNQKQVRYQQVLAEMFSTRQKDEIKSVMDVGCGYGEFLFALRDFFSSSVELEGFEPNEWKRNFAISHGQTVHSTMDFMEGRKADLIALLNVYSHLSNPCEDFRRYNNLLNTNGRLLIQTGDASGLTRSEMPRPYFLPDHLSFASEPIIQSLLERAGFVVEKVCRYPAIQFSWLQCVKEIIKFLLPQKKSNLRALLRHRIYAHRDMYILARKINPVQRSQ